MPYHETLYDINYCNLDDADIDFIVKEMDASTKSKFALKLAQSQSSDTQALQQGKNYIGESYKGWEIRFDIGNIEYKARKPDLSKDKYIFAPNLDDIKQRIDKFEGKNKLLQFLDIHAFGI